MENLNKVPTVRMFLAAITLGIGIGISPQTSFGTTYVLPHNGSIIGNIQHATVMPGDTLATLGLRHGVGGYEMMEANPGVSFRDPPVGATLIVPSRFILPEGSRQGIVINIAELRLYYYHPDGVHVSTYPIGVGQEGWDTPLGKNAVVRMREKPTWVVPDSIMENHLRHGKVIPKVKPAGPDNPLGEYAITTGFKNIVIHGTPDTKEKAVGLRSSHGCIRMRNSDVGDLYKMVKVGTPVEIIHQPVKIGQLDNKVYLESHVPVSETLTMADYRDVGSLIKKVTSKAGDKYTIEWQKVDELQRNHRGYPEPIGSIF
ncbi:L,D-transpeptidase family protein [Candidatus Berkiella aquae]|uniref:L,D-transpeptidase family protein n=1 Tax=Candidatus Berkiella aquae TaxID=295108 RepID=A0A0Q9YX68_9GAMM|nr:L,D-transpeptidase family protein [Candidatus Berkiella aquae]MCS5712675.1 L,D-transpeptidase family protein [Candidatus Berkiella aquae]